MRKSVEISLELTFLLILGPILLPVIAYFIDKQLMQTTTYGFLIVNVLIFSMRVVFFQNLFRYAIDSHTVAEVVEIVSELLQLAMTFYSFYMVYINPVYVLVASFCFPILHMTWIVKLGIIAYNKNLVVALGQSNVITNGNDMTQVTLVAFYSLLLKTVLLLYLSPFKIYNDPKKLWGPLYFLQCDFWASWCRRNDGDAYSDRRDAFIQTDAFLSLVEEDYGSPIEVALNLLLPEEKEMIEVGNYARPKGVVHGTPILQLERLNVVHKKKHLITDFSLTLFQGEAFVFIGDNGCGKSALIDTLSGLLHAHSGRATGYGLDLSRAGRYLTDNFLTGVHQRPILIDVLTTEEHILLMSQFAGIEDRAAEVKRILSEFKLQEVAKVSAIKLNQQQRRLLNFALCLLGNPKIILLDEPTLDMDASAKRLVWEII